MITRVKTEGTVIITREGKEYSNDYEGREL